MERSQQIMRALETLLAKQGFDPKRDERLPEHPGLNLLIPLQKDGTELIFCEAHFIRALDRFDVVQLYTTLVGELRPEAVAEVEKAIQVWNRDFLLGALGLFGGNQLYHRYCVTLPKVFPPEQAAAHAFDAFCCIVRQIAEYHRDALTLASGITFEQLCAM